MQSLFRQLEPDAPHCLDAAVLMAIMKESAHGFGKCTVVVTHDREAAKQADVLLEIKRGHLKEREM